MIPKTMISNTFNKIDSVLAATGLLFGILIILSYWVSPTIRLFSIGMALTLSCSLYLIHWSSVKVRNAILAIDFI